MWKFIGSLLLLIFLGANLMFILYTFWLKTYKVENELPSFYKYILLEGRIQRDFENFEGQNVLVEKGSNRVVKVQNYIITGDSVVDGFLLKEGNENRINFQAERISTLVRRHNDIDVITIERFGTVELPEFLTLTGIQLALLADDDSNFNQGQFPEIF